MKIIENLTTEVKFDCDILVCGGGVAGIAAAIAAARSGKKVILTERQFMLGGLATSGLVTIYLPLCDGYGKQVSFGLAEELLKLSIKEWHDTELGYLNWIEADNTTVNDKTTPRYEVNFNPQLFAISAEEELLKENVKILYGTTAVAASVTKDKVDAVILENKSGRFAITARSFIDATGDADLAKFSGMSTSKYSKGNRLAAWYYYNGENDYTLKILGESDTPSSDRSSDKNVANLSKKTFTGIDGEEISDMVCMSHEQILKHIHIIRNSQPDIQPLTIATIPQLRMTRRINGEYTLHDDEMHKYFEDSIGLISDWRKRGPVYEVPFRTLYSSKMKNLLFAGRITSVTDDMWDIMRVIPCCAVTGEAAGIAAAIGDDMTLINIKELQAELTKRGVKIHE